MRIWPLLSFTILAVSVPAVAADREQRLIVRGDRIFVPVTVNGRQTEALLDSAAELSLIDEAYAKSLGLNPGGKDTAKGSGGTEEVRFVQGVSVHAVGTDLKGLTVAALDLSPLSARLVGVKVSLILGREFFDAGRFEIDIEGGHIRRLSKTTKARGVALPLTSHLGIEEFPVEIEGKGPVSAALDLGNGSEMMVGSVAAKRLGLTAPGRVIETKKGGGLGGSIDRDIVSLSTVRIAGKTFRSVRAAIDVQDSQSDANIGVNLLRHFIIVTDFPGHRLWLARRKSDIRSN